MSETPVKRGRPKTPQPPVTARMWEYTQIIFPAAARPAELNVFGADGWELVNVYVRMDAVHAVFKREVV